MLLADIVDTSEEVASTSARSSKVTLLADLLRRLDPDEAHIGVAFLAGTPTQPKLGVGPATVYGAEVPPATSPSLEIATVDAILEEISEASGPGSNRRRKDLLEGLLRRATEREQQYLRALMVRNLRQGALEGVMAEAVASALGVDATRVRRAAMLEGDLVLVAARGLVDGPDSLKTASMVVGIPLQPMLAKTSSSAGEAIDQLGTGVVERKLDGLRLQVHRRGDAVTVFTRNLRDMTTEVPEVVASAMALDAESFILDGEGLVVAPDGSPLSFQDSMSRPGDDHGHRLSAFYFDVLHLDGVDLVDSPLVDRRRVLEALVPAARRVVSIVTNDANTADEFFEVAVSEGFEGVVVKDLNQAYEAGRRGSGWLKVKPTHTLDLVILGAEWGSGRREGWLSNLHLGAVGPDGDYVMLGKTFKGLTDEMLEWQTKAFLEIEHHRTTHVVFLEPEIVYEIAFDGVQRSTRYPGGVALRFARVKGVREDKGPQDADTLETVRSFMR
jgi:DNA ligase-1